jgi:hypothetical protein
VSGARRGTTATAAGNDDLLAEIVASALLIALRSYRRKSLTASARSARFFPPAQNFQSSTNLQPIFKSYKLLFCIKNTLKFKNSIQYIYYGMCLTVSPYGGYKRHGLIEVLNFNITPILSIAYAFEVRA